MALLRSLGVALLTWIAVGALNRALINIPDAADAVDPARELQQASVRAERSSAQTVCQRRKSISDGGMIFAATCRLAW
jgi:hypothetical protein